MKEKGEGLLYKKVCNDVSRDDVSDIRRRYVNLKEVLEVLDEARNDLLNTENELTEEWFAERDAEFHQKIVEKIEKWFGSVREVKASE